MRLNGQIKNPVFNAGTTYIVEENVVFSLSVVIPENVTLIFQGGKFVVAEDCTEEITISGTNTHLEAPICTIFGKGINIVGSWDIDRAYPQWFEIEKEVVSTEHIMIDSEGNNIYEDFPYDDWSTPINKAIKMKQVGEIFLRNGDYSIASPIIMNCRTQLVGECSQWGDTKKVIKKVLNEETNEEEDKDVYESIYGCARIFPVGEGESLYSHEYLLYVNAETDTKSPVSGMQYIDQSTLIKNICFTDWINKNEFTQHTQKCILAGGGVHLDKIVWYNFLQGVKYTDTYNDTRSITNCSFKHDQINLYQTENIDTTEEVSITYAIDTGWLGDALKFEHNAIHSTCNGKALKLFNCGGGSIQGNIINSDVLIEGCKAIVFNANHCENGIQVEIIDSCVTTNNNFFEKGARPNILIHNSQYGDKSVVSMNNEMFLMYNFPRFNIDINKTENEILESFQNQIQNISECDIHIDKNTILNINDVYRYEFGEGLMGKMYPFGINIEKNEFQQTDSLENEKYLPFDEFNKYSYLASCSSKILSGYKLNMQATINGINTPCLNCSQINGGVKWLGESGTYRYFYQIVWDKDREIMKTEFTTNIYESIKPINWYPEQADMSKDVVKITDEKSKQTSFYFSPGVLLDMSEDVNGNCTLVRLIRYKNVMTGLLKLSSYDFVEVPVCGSRYLYDNGISVCGYKWKPYEKLILSEPCDKNIEMLRINNGNVECFTKKEGGITPTIGWKRGDVIHNISSSNPSTYIVPDDIV